MHNVGCSLIGLHDPESQTIQFSGSFIGNQNVSFAQKNSDSATLWYVTAVGYLLVGGGTADITDAVGITIDGDGLLRYNKNNLLNAGILGGAAAIKPYFTMIKVNCKAYSPVDDHYEQLTFEFRVGQILD